MLEPDDDILIPPGPREREGKRMRVRHALRVLAFLLVASSIAYFLFCLRLDKAVTASQRDSDLLGVLPGIIFGACLWWYSGRQASDLHHPLIHRATDNFAPLGWRRLLFLIAGMVTGFLGLAAVTYGATIRLHGEELRKVVWANSEKVRSVIWVPEDSNYWGLISIETGTALIVVAGVTLYLARRRAATA